MLTDSGATVPAVEALHLGAHDFLLKEGISDLQLRQAVRSAIEKAAIHRELAAKRAERVRKGGAAAHLDKTEKEAAERPRA
jgi:FixJ family two-component response regulator